MLDGSEIKICVYDYYEEIDPESRAGECFE